MPRVVGRVDDIDDSIEISVDRAGAWGRLRIPRPSAIVAACLVAITLSRIPLLDPDFADSLALRYGWPLSLRLRGCERIGEKRRRAKSEAVRPVTEYQFASIRSFLSVLRL